MSKILAIRFSALGDVAMTIPVLYSFARQYPEHQVIVLSKPNTEALFADAPSNILFRGIDLKKDYRGLKGLSRLFHELKAEHFDAVADLHNVLRSKYLRWRFMAMGIPVTHIYKGRWGKKRLTARVCKRLVPQKTSFQRYADVFHRLGYDFPLCFHSIFGQELPQLTPQIEALVGKKNNSAWIGIAPFAAHRGKIYPLDLQEELIGKLSAKEDTRVFLFGGGKKEEEILGAWAEKFPHVQSVAGRLRMNEELLLMSRIDVMVTMDSGNMHLASLAGTPVVSIWGATHPFAGFMGWNQDTANAVEVELPCRPCSIYGNKPCRRKDYACLRQISPQMILNRINFLLRNR